MVFRGGLLCDLSSPIKEKLIFSLALFLVKTGVVTFVPFACELEGFTGWVWAFFSFLMVLGGGVVVVAPFSSPGDGDAARGWAYHNACCLPPCCLALLGLARPVTVCGTPTSHLGNRVSEPSRAGRLAFRSKLCSLGLGFSSCTMGRALCALWRRRPPPLVDASPKMGE